MPDPIDMDFLAAQTFGDRALQRELLRLFVDQATAIASRLEQGRASPVEIHTLKGSALAIGAAAVAEDAAFLEAEGRADGDGRREAAARASLRASVETACAFAARMLS